MKYGRRFTGVIVSLLIAVFTLSWVGTALAAGATLYLSPASKSVTQGATLSVAVRVNTGGNDVNAVQANLSYDSGKLDFLSISASGSAFEIQAQNSGGGGGVQIARGTTGSVNGDKLVATVNFKAKTSSGSTAVNFAGGSAVIRSSDNSDVLSGTSGGNYSFAAPAPRPASPAAPAAPAADTTAPKISGLKADSLQPRRAVIVWQTDEASTSLVDFGVDTNYGLTAQTPGSAATHQVTLQTNLLIPGSVYHYRVKSTDAANNTATSPDSTFQLPGYNAAITIVNHKRHPVKNATVTLPAEGKSAKTDGKGQVTIKDLTPDKHVVEVKVNGQSFNKVIQVKDVASDDPKLIAMPQPFELTVDEKPSFSVVDFTVGGALLLLLGLAIWQRGRLLNALKNLKLPWARKSAMTQMGPNGVVMPPSSGQPTVVGTNPKEPTPPSNPPGPELRL